jgi:hypothetical protein
MTEHSAGYAIESALKLARSLKYGPLPQPEDPFPDLEEALELIREERRTCDFNWLTGAAAEKVIVAHMLGKETAKKAG